MDNWENQLILLTFYFVTVIITLNNNPLNLHFLFLLGEIEILLLTGPWIRSLFGSDSAKFTPNVSEELVENNSYARCSGY